MGRQGFFALSGAFSNSVLTAILARVWQSVGRLSGSRVGSGIMPKRITKYACYPSLQLQISRQESDRKHGAVESYRPGSSPLTSQMTR